jgi:hypothetical protein
MKLSFKMFIDDHMVGNVFGIVQIRPYDRFQKKSHVYRILNIPIWPPLCNYLLVPYSASYYAMVQYLVRTTSLNT